MSDAPPRIPPSVLALLRHRWRTNDDGYSAFDSVFHGVHDHGDERSIDAAAEAKRQEHQRQRQMDPSYYNFAAYMDGVDPDHPFASAEAIALMRDAVFERVAEDWGDGRVMINEHAVHAMQDFCSAVYTEWVKCLDRIAQARQACPIEQSRAIHERDLVARRAKGDAALNDTADEITAITRAVAEFPELTAFGFGVFDERKLTPAERAEKFRLEREQMFSAHSIEEFNRVCDWLGRQARTKRINPRAGSSYGLKHAAEHEVGYSTNGMFIAAAVACGFCIQRIGDSPNAYLNISTTANNTVRRGDGTPIRLGHRPAQSRR
jgi:hypothetical protein